MFKRKCQVKENKKRKFENVLTFCYTINKGDNLMKITKCQQAVLDVIRDNPTATLQEIATKLGRSSASNIYKHIENLRKNDILIKNGGQYIVKEVDSPVTYLPFYGYAQCGYNDILQECNVTDYIPLPTAFLPSKTNDLFLIRAKGDSMHPTIKDHTLVLFRKNTPNDMPKQGQIVLAYYGEGLKIKRFGNYTENGVTSYRLTSDNKEFFEPIHLDSTDGNVQIVGTYVGIMDIEENKK